MSDVYVSMKMRVKEDTRREQDRNEPVQGKKVRNARVGFFECFLCVCVKIELANTEKKADEDRCG